MAIRLVRNGAGTSFSHNALKDRDLPDQHPISSISELTEKLEEIDIQIEETITDYGNKIEELDNKVNETIHNTLEEINNTIKKSSASIIEINQNNHELSVGDAVYNNNGIYKKADSSSYFSSRVIGIVKEIVDENNFVVVTSGLIQISSFEIFCDGTILYLANDGNLSDVFSSIIVEVGIKIPQGFVVRIEEPKITVQKSEIDDFIENLK